MTKIKSISRSDKNSKYEDGFLEYDKYLEDIYPIALKTLCEALDSCNKERDRNMGLANAICDYFEKYKKYDFDYYNKVLQKNNNFFDEGDKSLYNRYDYNVNGIKKLGYHTPNDKKVILINNTMICDGCSQLVFDIIDYCNKHLGYNIHCDKISSI